MGTSWAQVGLTCLISKHLISEQARGRTLPPPPKRAPHTSPLLGVGYFKKEGLWRKCALVLEVSTGTRREQRALGVHLPCGWKGYWPTHWRLWTSWS